MTLIDLKVKTEYLQKIKRANISDVLQCVRGGLLTGLETPQSTGLAMLLEPYLSREPLGDTSDEGPERAVPSKVAATPCLGEPPTRLLSKGVLMCSSNNLMRPVLPNGPPVD